MAIQNPLYGRELSEGEAALVYQPLSNTLTKLSQLAPGTGMLSLSGGGEFTLVQGAGPSSTDMLPEGTTNLYLTDTRVRAAITGAASTVLSTNATPSRVLISDAGGKVSTSTTTTSELSHLSGTTSNLQVQLAGINTAISSLTTTNIPEGSNQYFTSQRAVLAITGAASSISTSNLLSDRVLVSDAGGKVGASTITTTELSHLAGSTSPIQVQLNTLMGRAITAGPGITGGGTLSSNITLGIAYEGNASNIKASNTTPSVGVLDTIARADHIHPPDSTKVDTTSLGTADGVATLDSSTKVPTSQIPTITTTVGFGGEVISVPYTGTGITIPVPVSQGGTGVTSTTEALSVLGAQPVHPTLTSIASAASGGILVKDTLGVAQVRSLQVNNPLTITNPSGSGGNPTISLTQGEGSGLDADLLDGAHGSAYFKVDGSVSYSAGTATAIRTNIAAASSGVNTDITSLGNVAAIGNTSTNHIRIPTTGELLVGKSTVTVNGGDVQLSKGLTFPSPQVACANVNTLDDYREGTWTPSIDSITSGTGRVTTVRYAAFTKVGNLVTFTAFVDMGTLGTGGTGTTVINGLPYVASSVANAYWAVSIPYFNGLKATLVSLGGTVQPGTAYVFLRGWGTAIANVPNLDFATYIQAGSAFILSGFYYT